MQRKRIESMKKGNRKAKKHRLFHFCFRKINSSHPFWSHHVINSTKNIRTPGVFVLKEKSIGATVREELFLGENARKCFTVVSLYLEKIEMRNNMKKSGECGKEGTCVCIEDFCDGAQCERKDATVRRIESRLFSDHQQANFMRRKLKNTHIHRQPKKETWKKNWMDKKVCISKCDRNVNVNGSAPIRTYFQHTFIHTKKKKKTTTTMKKKKKKKMEEKKKRIEEDQGDDDEEEMSKTV
uniref:Uncharacterized protein n=1 Tax=Caenorhabditis tropicalis TaxID=1561998 RepID=A0A1I7TBW4_9PELO